MKKAPYYPARQAPGTTGEHIRHINIALAASPNGSRPWGVSTECGMGRVRTEDIAGLLELHRQILANG